MMRRRLSWKQFLLPTAAMALVFGLVFNDGRVNGDDKADGKAAAESKEGKERAKPRGRLPNYFAAVVSEVQRESIYAIQAKYREQIEALEAQIEALEQQRDKEVDAVLTPEQLQQVNQKRAEAEERRKSRSKE